ncbi:MAG: hypothetical protein QOF47_2641 [Mycobacterium sp.]|nr:hypothetical protein [Mycobacterium sp.]
MLLKLRWKPGPATDAPAFVAATRTDFARYRDIAPAALAALRLRRAVPRSIGQIGLGLAMAPPWRKTTWSISAWSSPDELRAFLGSPEHVAVVERFRNRVRGRSETWTVSPFVRRDAWRTAIARLATDQEDESAPSSR